PRASAPPLASLLPVLARPPPSSTLFPYTTLFRSRGASRRGHRQADTGFPGRARRLGRPRARSDLHPRPAARGLDAGRADSLLPRSEEHTSELQSRENLVCRLLLEKKKMPTSARSR